MNLKHRLQLREFWNLGAAFSHCFCLWFCRAAGVTAGACVGLFFGMRLLGFIVRK